MVIQVPTNKNLPSVSLLMALETLCRKTSFLKSLEAQVKVAKSVLFAQMQDENCVKASGPFGWAQIVNGRGSTTMSGLGKDITELVEGVLGLGGLDLGVGALRPPGKADKVGEAGCFGTEAWGRFCFRFKGLC